MRWIISKKKKPEIGSKKLRTRFLLFPMKLRNLVTEDIEYRWLEACKIVYQYYGEEWGYDWYTPAHWEKLGWFDD